jgi:hypothetical protein
MEKFKKGDIIICSAINKTKKGCRMLGDGDFRILDCHNDGTFLIESIKRKGQKFDRFEMRDFEFSPSYIRKMKLDRINETSKRNTK